MTPTDIYISAAWRGMWLFHQNSILTHHCSGRNGILNYTHTPIKDWEHTWLRAYVMTSVYATVMTSSKGNIKPILDNSQVMFETFWMCSLRKGSELLLHDLHTWVCLKLSLGNELCACLHILQSNGAKWICLKDISSSFLFPLVCSPPRCMPLTAAPPFYSPDLMLLSLEGTKERNSPMYIPSSCCDYSSPAFMGATMVTVNCLSVTLPPGLNKHLGLILQDTTGYRGIFS